MKSIFHPLDDMSQVDYRDQTTARLKNEPITPPSGKPSQNYTESERVAVELRAKRQLEERERIAAALKALVEDRQRDKVIEEAVAAIQDAAIPAIVKIDNTEVLVGESGTAPQIRSTIEERLAEPQKPGKPPWLPVLWAAILESAALELTVEVGLPPVKVSVSIDLIKFAQRVTELRKGSA